MNRTWTALRSATTRRVALLLGFVLIGTVAVSSPAPAAIPDGSTGEVFTNVAVLGTNSVIVKTGAAVTGAVIANDPPPVLEPGDPAHETLFGGFALTLSRNAVVTGNAAGDSVLLNRNSTVNGEVAYNTLDDKGASGFTPVTPVDLPVFSMLPPFREASVRPDPGDPALQPFNIAIAAGATQTVGPGEYGDVTIGSGGTLVLTGGEYHVRSISTVDNSTISFASPSDVLVEGRVAIGQSSVVGPANGSLDASDIVIYAGGTNGGDGSPDALPAAVDIGQASDIDANLYAARGTVVLRRNSTLDGSVLARDADLHRDTTTTVKSAYGNNAPVAVSQVVADDTEVRLNADGTPVPIVLESTDPDGDALTFTLLSLPMDGTLSEGGTAIGGPAPVTLAGNVLEYTPTAPVGPAFDDDFTFQTDDGDLPSNVAKVEIRGPEDDANPGGVQNIVAKDFRVETTGPVDLTLVAAAVAEESLTPLGDLTFSIVAPPPGTEGTLGAVVDVIPDPLPPPDPTPAVRTATVTFTPAGGFTGATSFDFQACEVAVPANCDSATVTIDVNDPAVIPPPAIGNVQAQILEGGTAVLDLQVGGDQTGPQPPPSGEDGRLGFRAVPKQGAPPPVTIDSTVAWNVADNDFDGFGDEHNVGGVPALISATNNTTGGPGSNGLARVHIEFDIANVTGVIGQAEVTVHTSPGTSDLDTLDTMFYVAIGDGDGAISFSDWETPASQLAGVVLPNQTGISSFTFDVTDELQAAVDAGFSWFVVQGRVVESPLSQNPGGERGMQIRSQFAGAGANPPELTYSLSAEPDLVVSSLTHDPVNPTTEDTITFTAVVTNQGTAAAGPSTLSHKIGGESPTTPAALFAVPALAPGESFTAVRTAQLIAQNYQNTAVADFDNDVTESDEANNTTLDFYTVVEAEEVRPVVGTFKITSLPTFGTLFDSQGTAITSLPMLTPLPDSTVTYVAGPNAVVGEIDQFQFEATNIGGTTAAFGYIGIVAELLPPDECVIVGRSPGCVPG